jgi:acyl-CoA reductase-like NAD-dependent aldehyde dehydrogenase
LLKYKQNYGKRLDLPLYDSEGEFAVSLMWMEFACDNVEEVLKDDHDGGISKDAIGVVSAITPWNYPIFAFTPMR